ncbi:hypothetical protein BH11GEM2_BH11GEM2_06740 [soil metagenome]
MTEPMSRLDQMRRDAINHAHDKIVLALRSQDVSEVAALQFVENNVTFTVDPSLKVRATSGRHGMNGSTDDHLVYFARTLHLHNPWIGGKPVGFAGEMEPENESVREYAERVTAAITANADAERARLRSDEAARVESAQRRAESTTAAHSQAIRGMF